MSQPEMSFNPGADQDLGVAPGVVKWVYGTLEGTRTNNESGFEEPIRMVMMRASTQFGAFCAIMMPEEAEDLVRKVSTQIAKAKSGLVTPGDNGFHQVVQPFHPLGEDE